VSTATYEPRPALRLPTSAGRWVLAATVLGSAIAAIDATVVGIALPAIGKDFDATLSVLQWAVTAYTLTLTGLLLLGGAVGDRYGRRRVFVVGVVVFAIASGLCGLAPSAEFLIVARALQGVGGALLTPGSLAILQASFAPEDRGAAIGAWSGLGGVATALGPALGGWLVQTASWRLIFYVNLPLAVAVVAIAARHVPETRTPPSGAPLDVAGGALITAGLICVTFAIIEGPSRGWSTAPVLVTLTAGALSLVAFVVRERHAPEPLLPLGIFRNGQFTTTNIVTFVMYGALGGTLFLLPLQLQQVLRYSPTEAGLSLLPVTVIMLLLSARSGALAAHIGPRLQMSLGPVIVATGLLLMVRIDAGGTYAGDVLPAVVVLGLGLAATVAPLTSTALSSAPVEHAGLGSAVNNDVARAGGLVAVAVLPPLAGLSGFAYLHPSLLSHGFHVAVVISAALCVVAGLIALTGIRDRAAQPAAATSPPPRCCPLEGPPPPAFAAQAQGFSVEYGDL